MLELVRVAKTYGVKVIFKDVSCAFAPASVTMLVGGNGAGKSTLMRIMAGLSRPSAGEPACYPYRKTPTLSLPLQLPVARSNAYQSPTHLKHG